MLITASRNTMPSGESSCSTMGITDSPCSGYTRDPGHTDLQRVLVTVLSASRTATHPVNWKHSNTRRAQWLGLLVQIDHTVPMKPAGAGPRLRRQFREPGPWPGRGGLVLQSSRPACIVSSPRHDAPCPVCIGGITATESCNAVY